MLIFAPAPGTGFSGEIARIKALARRFEPVRSLVERPLESASA